MHLACHQKHIWNLLQLLGLFTCRKLAHLSQNSSLKCETTSWNYQALHFWSVLLLKEHMVTSVRKMLKTLVWSAQSRLIPGENCLENNHKIGCFLSTAFWWSFNCPKNSAKITTKSADFSSNLSLKIPRNLTFSSATCQKPWQVSLLTGYTEGRNQLKIDRVDGSLSQFLF